MPLELVNTFATLGTFLVIAATAIAAIVQLRHMRGSNQIAALNELRETIASHDVQSAEHFIRTELPEKLKDPTFRYQLATPAARTDENRRLIQRINVLGNFYEGLGVLVKAGLVDRALALDMWSARLEMHWEALAPVVAILRRAAGIGLWENLEYIAVLSQDWNAEHPNGTYPRDVRRIVLKDGWLEADTQYAGSLATTQ